MTITRSGVHWLTPWAPLADQFLVGAASGILLIAGSATMDPDELGPFGFAYSAIAVMTVIWRGGFLARMTLLDPREVVAVTMRLAVMRIAWLSPFLVLAVVLLVWAVNSRSGLTPSTVALCSTLPVMLACDVLRQGLLGAGERALPLKCNAIWLSCTICSLALTLWTDSPWPVLLTWLVAGISGCTILWRRMMALRARNLVKGLATNETQAGRPVWHFNTVAAVSAFASLGVAAAALHEAGPAAMAQIVVLNAVLYPLSVCTQATPLLARSLRGGRLSAPTLFTIGILAGAGVWFASVTWVFPGLVGLAFGPTWAITQSLLWLATLNLVAGALVAATVAELNQRGRLSPVRRTLLIGSPARVAAAWIVAGITGSAGWIIAVECLIHGLMCGLLILQSRSSSPHAGECRA